MACRAPTRFRVEGEPSFFEAELLCQLCRRKQLAELFHQTAERRRASARGSPDRFLIGDDAIFDLLKAFDRTVFGWRWCGQFKLVFDCGYERLPDECALAASADAGDYTQNSQWNFDVNAFEVVPLCTVDFDRCRKVSHDFVGSVNGLRATKELTG